MIAGSGCKMWTVLCLSNSANWCVVWKLSPAETGTVSRRATSAVASIFV